MIDRQSVKTTGVGGVRGYDGAKKLSGRTRHLLVETTGLVLQATVHSAALQDRAAVPRLLTGVPERFPRLRHGWVDQGDPGSGKTWIEAELGWTGEVVRPPPKARGEWVPLGTGEDPQPFAWRRLPPERTGVRGILPRRWVVERPCSWTSQRRRLSKDDERLCETSEALISLTMIRIKLKRLARVCPFPHGFYYITNGITTGARQPEGAWAKWAAETPNWSISRGQPPARAELFDAWAKDVYEGVGQQMRVEVYRESLRHPIRLDLLFHAPTNVQTQLLSLIRPALDRLWSGAASAGAMRREPKPLLQPFLPKELP